MGIAPEDTLAGVRYWRRPNKDLLCYAVARIGFWEVATWLGWYSWTMRGADYGL